MVHTYYTVLYSSYVPMVWSLFFCTVLYLHGIHLLYSIVLTWYVQYHMVSYSNGTSLLHSIVLTWYVLHSIVRSWCISVVQYTYCTVFYLVWSVVTHGTYLLYFWDVSFVQSCTHTTCTLIIRTYFTVLCSQYMYLLYHIILTSFKRIELALYIPIVTYFAHILLTCCAILYSVQYCTCMIHIYCTVLYSLYIAVA